MTEQTKTHPPVHQWTHDGTRVLLVKQIGADRKTGGMMDDHSGKNAQVIDWPTSGIVEAPDWDPTPKCGGGLHAWPWGMSVGEGKDPNALLPHLVLAADPADIVLLDGGKIKAQKAEVVHSGTFASSMYFTQAGRIAWIVANAAGNTSSGDSSSAASSGDRSSAASSGDRSSAASSGYRSSAASSGDSSSAASSGDRSSAASSGYSSSAKAAGRCSIASICGCYGTLEVSPSSIGAVHGARFTWVVRAGAVVIQRWEDRDAKTFPFAVLNSAALGLTDGETVSVIKGEIQK